MGLGGSRIGLIAPPDFFSAGRRQPTLRCGCIGLRDVVIVSLLHRDHVEHVCIGHCREEAHEELVRAGGLAPSVYAPERLREVSDGEML